MSNTPAAKAATVHPIVISAFFIGPSRVVVCRMMAAASPFLDFTLPRWKKKNSGHDLPNPGRSSETAAGKEKEVWQKNGGKKITTDAAIVGPRPARTRWPERFESCGKRFAG